ncbi:conjugative transposon protein TraN [Emticicia sp. TH156]|uniref:conjugative transposon protein TraN n=1 Tax=Emticicia sp. TH156 TaxID=2067454 RepID=UPI000C78F5D4|nr:conjugative transposon protein TraN [Emticicia sp. TH156]PLK44997.1 conjugative transposon protein TraN [Emticicia sp. TH156]
MRTVSVVWIMNLGLFLTYFSGNAQQPAQSIPSRELQITYAKTTNIVFPYAIKSVDRGSKDVLAQKAGGMENILQLKAAKEDFEETNMTVVTADGGLYVFTINYARNPDLLNLLLVKETQTSGTIQFDNQMVNEAQLGLDASLLLDAHIKTIRKRDRKFGITLLLTGLFIRDNVIYYRLILENDTNLSYDVDQLRFFIRDQEKAKRTATQEVEVKPLYVEGNISRISGNTQQIVIFALPKFTIPDGKYLAVLLMEKNGGRNLDLKIRNNTVVQAMPVASSYSSN